jgi:hypothetical protein
MQSGPWPGRAARARPTPASWQCCRPGKRPCSTTSWPGVHGVPGLGRRGGRRQVLAVAAAARGKPARRRDAGQLASARATLEPRGSTGVVDRQWARAVSSSTGRRRQWRRAARDGARRGGQGAFIRGSARPWVTRGDDGDACRATAARGSRVRRRSRRRTAGPWRPRAYGGAPARTRST